MRNSDAISAWAADRDLWLIDYHDAKVEQNARMIKLAELEGQIGRARAKFSKRHALPNLIAEAAWYAEADQCERAIGLYRVLAKWRISPGGMSQATRTWLFGQIDRLTQKLDRTARK